MRTEIEERLTTIQKAYLDRAFDRHLTTDVRVIDMRGAVREACRQTASVITFLPQTAERRKALEKIEEALFWAHACLARDAEMIVKNLDEQEG